MRLTGRLIGAIGIAFVGIQSAVSAEVYPAYPLKLEIGFAPGGIADVMARLFQTKLAQEFGAPVIIDNRPGAGGVIASNYVAKAKPDGYTALISWDAHVINSLALKNLPFDTKKDFTPVVYIGRFPYLMVTKKDFAGNTVKDLVESAKAQPGKLNFMSVGAASPTRLQAEILIQNTGIKAVAVPYKGAAPALMAMLGGEVTFGFLSYPAVKSQIAAGTIKVLAVTGEARMPELPNVPTMAESGYPGSQSYSWEGLFVPAKTPANIVAKLNTAFNKTLADPEVKRKLRENGIETVGGTTASFNKFVTSEFDKWTNFVRVTKITFDD